MQTPLDPTFATLKNNIIFRLRYFHFQHKTASRKQRYLCQRFPLAIPIHTWKISWIERLIYFLRPHMANRSHLTQMNMAKRRVGVMEQCLSPGLIISFLLLLSSHSILGNRKKCVRSPVQLNCLKKRTSIQQFDFTVRKNLHPFSHSTLPFEKNYICSAVQLNRSKKSYIHSAVQLNCSKKICICSGVQPICFKRLVQPFLICSLAVRLAVRTDTFSCQRSHVFGVLFSFYRTPNDRTKLAPNLLS